MQYLLNDEDLHRIAYDEEMAEDAIDYSITLSDIRDIINQLEGKTAPSVVDNLTI
jgi:hypothetical protein